MRKIYLDVVLCNGFLVYTHISKRKIHIRERRNGQNEIFLHTLSLREEEKEVGKDKGVHIKSILAWIEKENKEQVDSFQEKDRKD